MVLGKLDSYMYNNEIKALPNTIHKYKFKMDLRPKCRLRNYKKLLEENISRTLNDINQSKILYDPPPRIMAIKTEVSKWDLIKLKCFCTAKDSMLLLLLSRFSRVQLCDPIDSSVPEILQARILDGLPFPSPIHACMLSCFSSI